MQTQNITLDFCRNDYKTVTVKQYDKDSRNLLITCTDNGSVYKLNSSTQQCNVKMNTPDNRAIYNTATITDGGKVLMVFDENMVYTSGTGQLEIQIIEQSTKHTLSSMILTVIIVGSVYPDDTIIASDEFNALTEALLSIGDSTQKAEEIVTQANETIERIEELENAVETAETARTTAETARKSSETARQENETVRESNETKRIANEKTRQSNASTVLENAEKAVELANTAVNNANEAAENAIEATNEAKAVLTSKVNVSDVIDDLADIEENTEEGKVAGALAVKELCDEVEVIKSMEGTTIVATDCSDAGFEELHLYGKSKQVTTTGAQLLDLSNGRSGTGADVTFTNNGDSTYKMSGTATDQHGNIWFLGGYMIEPADDDSNVIVTLEAGTYTVKDCVLFTVIGGGMAAFTDTFTLTEAAKITGVRNPKMIVGTAYNTTLYPMLNKGTEPLPWEKFTGGKPSPNPEYPQEVVSVGDSGSVEGKVCGAQLLDLDSFENGLINGDTGKIISSTSWKCHDYCECESGTDYYISQSTDAYFQYTIGFYDDNKDFISIQVYNGNVVGRGVGFTTPTDAAYMRISYSTKVGSGEVDRGNIMLNVGTEPLPYEPYKEQTITLQTPNGLPGIPVSDASLATYTDENGQMWCADEKDYERGVYVKRIGKCIPKMVYQVTQTEKGNTVIMLNTLSNVYTSGTNHTANVISNRFKGISFAYGDSGNTGITVANNQLRIYISSDYGITTTAEADALLKQWEDEGAPLVAYYPLATPIETPLSDEEILAYKALHTNKPTTTIMNSENVYMKARVITGGIGQDIVDIIETELSKNNDEIEEIVNVKLAEEATARDEADNAILEKIDDIQEVIKTVDGSTIVINDSAETAFQGLHLYGKSEQGSTTGAQLYDSSFRWTTTGIFSTNGIVTESNGVFTCVVNAKDMFVYLHCDKGGTYDRIHGPLIEIPEGVTQLHVSLSNSAFTKHVVSIFDSDKISLGWKGGSTSNFACDLSNHPTAKYITLRFGLPDTIESGTYETTVMVNYGSEPLPWEPYTNCKPSPNPEYPQEIVSAGNGGSIDGKVIGKNLYPYGDLIAISDGMTLNMEKIDLCPGSYTLSLKTNMNDSVQTTIAFYDVDKNPVKTLGLSNGQYYNRGRTGLTFDKSVAYMSVYVREAISITNIQIECGDMETEYEPYKEQTITLQTPNGLPGIPLGTTIPDVIKNSPIHMSGVYWDNKEGLYYIADTVDAEKWVRVQRIRVINITHAHVNNVYITNNGLKWAFNANVTNSLLHYTGPNSRLYVMNNRFTLVSQLYEDDESSGTCLATYGHANNLEFRFRLLQSEFPTKEDVVNAVNGTTVYYPLATPIETPLSDEEILAYKALHTNKPTTTIMNSENVYMKVKYVAGCIGGDVARIVESYVADYLSKASITYGTEDLEAGVSTLAAGTFYFVYE